MKSSLFTAVFVLFAAAVFAVPGPIKVASSSISWKGYKVTGEHAGTMKFKSGNLTFENNVLKGGDLVVDMNSLSCTDLSGEGKGSLEGHLKSADFFGVEAHPTANIKFKKVVATNLTGDYRITADITIKNITKEIKFNANAKNGVATAAIKLDRSDFDVRYGSGSFFDNLGDKTIYDEFDLNISVNY